MERRQLIKTFALAPLATVAPKKDVRVCNLMRIGKDSAGDTLTERGAHKMVENFRGIPKDTQVSVYDRGTARWVGKVTHLDVFGGAVFATIEFWETPTEGHEAAFMGFVNWGEGKDIDDPFLQSVDWTDRKIK